MLRFVLAFCGVMLLGSIGAFFLFVPPVLIAAVSVATVVLFLLAFITMFWIGAKAEIEPTLMAGSPDSPAVGSA